MNQTAEPVEAVLFDSGGVLLQHRHAFLELPPVRQTLRELQLTAADDPQIAAAFAVAGSWLASQQGSVLTEQSAAAQRLDYYRQLLAALEVNPSPDQLDQLRDSLEGSRWIQPFPEVREVLGVLHGRGVKLGLLSDNWASTINLYEQLGLSDYFESWTFSAVVGCCKPDPRIYAAAAQDLAVPAARILFVDDLPENVAGAAANGWQVAWMNRFGLKLPAENLHAVRNLWELLALIPRS